MTVPNDQAMWGPYFGNDVNTIFPIGQITSPTDIVVKTTVLATGETITLSLNASGEFGYLVSFGEHAGQVVTNIPLPSTKSLVARRILPLTQLADIKNQGAFHAEIHEDVFDHLAMVDMQLQSQMNEFALNPATPINISLTTNRVLYSPDSAHISTDPALTWESAVNRLTVGDSGSNDANIKDQSTLFVQKNQPGTVLQFAIASQTTLIPMIGAAPIWQGAIIGQALHTATCNGFAVDVTGVVGQGKIFNTGDGRAFGGVFEAYIEQPTGDGLLIALEAGIKNAGSEVIHPLASGKPKINIWIADHGPNKITAGIAFQDTGNWHFGFYMRNITNVFILMETPKSIGAIGVDIKNNANWGNSMVMANGAPLAMYDATGENTVNIINMSLGNSIAIGQDTNATEVVLFGGTVAQFKTSDFGLGFYGADPQPKAVCSGSRASGEALNNLLIILNSNGLITNTTTA